MTRATRLLRLVGSWIGVGIGVPLLIRAELGVAPFDVLNTGVSDATGWSLGVCFVVDASFFYGIGRLLGARLGWASFVGTIVIGPLINLFLSIIPQQQALVARLALYAAGILIIAVAICMVVSTELGAGPSEVMMLGLITHGLGVVPARWISDGTPLMIGAALGGALGPGTLAFAVLMGPLVKFGLRKLHFEPAHRAPA